MSGLDTPGVTKALGGASYHKEERGMSFPDLRPVRPSLSRASATGGGTRRDGRLPVNLSGGLKAKGHPVGATGVSMHVLNARHLVGEADEMRLTGAELARAVNMGGGAVATYATVLERAK